MHSNNIKKYFILSLVLVGVSLGSYAQSSDTLSISEIDSLKKIDKVFRTYAQYGRDNGISKRFMYGSHLMVVSFLGKEGSLLFQKESRDFYLIHVGDSLTFNLENGESLILENQLIQISNINAIQTTVVQSYGGEGFVFDILYGAKLNQEQLTLLTESPIKSIKHSYKYKMTETEIQALKNKEPKDEIKSKPNTSGEDLITLREYNTEKKQKKLTKILDKISKHK